ncbi:hypothetical protein QF038_001801 [Pseudarthrobacter sp. W1I19]|uniref:hypothetical protein n=1 Tax=Pseudarthrobacter sp. W1I19 TaxID=3042288 RepID=UPI00278743B3|nr:hypothetical protein [Pseudarthrobacter sp. W1I19]MDQ0923293.1 hypothetical protein [Pseudarthrobacter sp. W1I19]
MSADQRQAAARELRKVKKIMKRLSRLYPELSTTLSIQERRFIRSVAAAIMVAESAGERDGT